MSIVISFGIQKGGCGKTTSSCITSFLLAREHKVLAVDFDSQGNLTQILTMRDIYQFEGRTVLNAVVERDARSYIVPVTDNLHVLPADDYLITLDRHLGGFSQPSLALQEIIEQVRHEYDFIIIDLPPHLGTLTVNGLAASDYAVVVLQTEPLCWRALDRYMELIQTVNKEVGTQIAMGGILLTMRDTRATLDQTIVEKVREDYEDWVFETAIHRRTRIKEFTLTGVADKNAHDRKALMQYESFVEELLSRVKERQVQ